MPSINFYMFWPLGKLTSDSRWSSDKSLYCFCSPLLDDILDKVKRISYREKVGEKV